MIKKFKQFLKESLYSSSTPDFLFELYFNKKEKKKRNQLIQLINQKADLLDAVKENQKEYWQKRIKDVLNAKENVNISRHKYAGQIVDENLIMHNGIKVDPLSYYSFPLLKMLIDNKGVHEPEEEKVFQEVVKSLDPSKKMNMLELGSYWSFYSMWLLSLFPNANCYMIEPDRKNLFYGKRNFKINRFNGKFIYAGIGKEKNRKHNITTVDEICGANKILFLDILHSDIQGYELEMLQGSEKMLTENRVGYVFVSTHSNELHYDCKTLLDTYDFIEVASVDLEETSSWDGILVMKSPNYKGLEKVELLKNNKR